MNPLSPDQMSTTERHNEIAGILTAGLMRLRARKSSPLSAHYGEICVDFPASERGDLSA